MVTPKEKNYVDCPFPPFYIEKEKEKKKKKKPLHPQNQS
jgi:hypothetical protein